MLKYVIKFIVEILATISTVIGAILTSINIFPYNLYILNLGSLLWLVWSVFDRKVSIFLVNTTLLITYLYGIVKVSDSV